MISLKESKEKELTDAEKKALMLAGEYVFWYGRYTYIPMLDMTLEEVYAINLDLATKFHEYHILNPEVGVMEPLEKFKAFEEKLKDGKK